MANQETLTPLVREQDNSIGLGTIIEDCGKSFVQAAVITPLWNGVGQLVSCGHLPQVSIVNADNAKKSATDCWAQKIGGAAGMALDLVVLSKFRNGVLGGALDGGAAQSLSLGQKTLTGAINGVKLGAFYGAVLTPSDSKSNLVLGRIANAGSEAISIGMLSGGSAALTGLKVFGKIQPGTVANVLKDMSITGAVGIPAGASGAVAGSLLNGRKLSASEMREAAADNGIMGFALAGLTHGLGALRGSEPALASDTEGTRTPANSSVDRTQDLNDEAVQSSLSKSDFNFDFSNKPRVLSAGKSSAFSPAATEGLVRGTPSQGELEEHMRGLKAMLSNVELPITATSEASTWRFIPEKAFLLDAEQLELLSPRPELQELTEQGDKIVQIKRYINSTGQPAHEYLARVLKTSDVTIVGEQHTLNVPNPHRVLGADAISELPAGSTLAVEMPSSLKPLFEEFNNSPGSDFRLTGPIANELSLQPSLSLLRAAQTYAPEMIDMWKSARDKGIHVIPIDAEPDPSVELTNGVREGHLADELLELSRAGSKPVVAWLGNMHAARNTEGGAPLLAQRLAESPEFASGQKKLSTVLSQISETEAEHSPMQVLAKNLSEPVGIPTRQGGQETPVGDIAVLDEATAKSVQTTAKASNYDHVVLYPPAPSEMAAAYRSRRAEALMTSLHDGPGFPRFDSSLYSGENSIWPQGFPEPENDLSELFTFASGSKSFHDFEVNAPSAVGNELQRVFGTTDLRTIPAAGKPFPGVDGLFVNYRPEFNDLYTTGITPDYPGRSMILKLDDQGLPHKGHTIADPDQSLAAIFQSNGLPFLADAIRS
jgi:hypothetical protein